MHQRHLKIELICADRRWHALPRSYPRNDLARGSTHTHTHTHTHTQSDVRFHQLRDSCRFASRELFFDDSLSRAERAAATITGRQDGIQRRVKARTLGLKKHQRDPYRFNQHRTSLCNRTSSGHVSRLLLIAGGLAVFVPLPIRRTISPVCDRRVYTVIEYPRN